MLRIVCQLFIWSNLIIMLCAFTLLRRVRWSKAPNFIRSPYRALSTVVIPGSVKNDGLLSSSTDDIIEKYKDELVSLRGDPELIDKLEYLTLKYPSIEVNPKIYQLFFPFKLDDFQIRGLQSLIEGNSVLVMTPTGSGKTIVGELAIYFALMMGLRVVYTTPLKALSNQKFQDFRSRFGGDRVGLLTGEISINKFAPVVIMTTEVLRNMIYNIDGTNRDALNNIFMICFDEFHYMNDPDRGTVWEECLISCPPAIRILALSATVGNIHDIRDWISTIHGPTEIIQSDYRPVPLRYLYAVRPGLFPYFRDPNAGPGSLNGVSKKHGNLEPGSRINPAILRLERDAEQDILRSSPPGRGRGKDRDNDYDNRKLKRSDAAMITRSLVPSYNKIIEELYKINKLPAIIFIFSRDGCEEAARSASSIKYPLLNAQDRRYVETAVEKFLELNPMIPVTTESINLLKKGISVHHAGLITVWKGLIEELFIANKIKVLFATETLAAGVNMPARTTVITSVSKKIGKTTTMLRTSQLLQMAGRAGRRGIDTEGTVVLMRNRFDPPTEGHRILVSPIDGIQSQFKASYAFVVKLLSTKSLEDCKALIERGFGTFLAQKTASKKKNKHKAALLESSVKLYPILLQYGLKDLKEYMKLLNRLKKEKNTLDYLISRSINSDQELIDVFTDYMSIGSLIQLKSGDVGYFLGDMMIDENTIYFYSDYAKKLSKEKEERETSYQRSTEENDGSKPRSFFENLFSKPSGSTSTSSTSGSSSDSSSGHSSQILLSINEQKVPVVVPEKEDKSFGKKNNNKTRQKCARRSAYGLITQSGEFLCFRKNDIQHLVSLENSLEEELFSCIVDLILNINGWEKIYYETDIQKELKNMQFLNLPSSTVSQDSAGTKKKGKEKRNKEKEWDEEEDSVRRIEDGTFEQYFYKARYSLKEIQSSDSELYDAINYIRSLPPYQAAKDITSQQQRNRHEIKKQENLLLKLQQEYQSHPITVNNETNAVLEFFDYLSTIKDEKSTKAFIDQQFFLLNSTRAAASTNFNNLSNLGGSENEPVVAISTAWLMFLEVIKILENFHAIEFLPRSNLNASSTFTSPSFENDDDGIVISRSSDGNLSLPITQALDGTIAGQVAGNTVVAKPPTKRLTYKATEFGEMVGSLTTENDLWVGLVIRNPALEKLTPPEFAALMAAIMCDSSKVTAAFYKYETSSNLNSVIDELLPSYQALYDMQQEYEIDFPILLSSEICGIVEEWAKGMTWLELCHSTSLEQGDLYRILKRASEILRSIPQAYQVSPDIVDKAKLAFSQINRFPLVESIEDVLEGRSASDVVTINTQSPEDLAGDNLIVESPVELSHAELEEEETEENPAAIEEMSETAFDELLDKARRKIGKRKTLEDLELEDIIPSATRRSVSQNQKARKLNRSFVEKVRLDVEENEYDFTEEDFLLDPELTSREGITGNDSLNEEDDLNEIDNLLSDIAGNMDGSRVWRNAEGRKINLKEQVEDDEVRKLDNTSHEDDETISQRREKRNKKSRIFKPKD